MFKVLLLFLAGLHLFRVCLLFTVEENGIWLDRDLLFGL